ncbi:MAG TPA: hypothetical protein ENI88_13920 [Desulfobulbus sp.]|nr:hypothetical protein [Desulfobulbus sp.]
MKYLLTIVIIALASTVLALFYLKSDSSPAVKDAVLSVNGHVFSRDFFKNQIKNNGYHREDKEQLLNSVITRELLIQEAQRLGIDREESFRKSLKNYYEQSLIKILTDREYKKLQIDVSEKEVDAYLSCFGKIFTFTILPVSGEQNTAPRQRSVLFDDLSDSLRLLLSELKPGESKEQFDTGSQVGKIRLDKVEPAPDYKPDETVDRQHIRTLLTQQKKAQRISSWMNDLRSRASIIVYEKADSHEQ